MLAADTLVYLGDLAKVFPPPPRLAPDGYFLFTLEAASGGHGFP